MEGKKEEEEREVDVNHFEAMFCFFFYMYGGLLKTGPAY